MTINSIQCVPNKFWQAISTVDEYLLYTQPLHEIKNHYKTIKAYAFPIRHPLKNLFGVLKYGITAPFINYPKKKPEEGYFSHLKNLSLYGIQGIITKEYLRGCYNLGKIPGIIMSIIGGYTVQAAGIALQICKNLLNLMVFAAINVSAIALATTALTVDRVIRGFLYFLNKQDAYNSAIDKKFIEKLPLRYASLVRILRGYYPKPSAEMKERYNKVMSELKETIQNKNIKAKKTFPINDTENTSNNQTMKDPDLVPTINAKQGWLEGIANMLF